MRLSRDDNYSVRYAVIYFTWSQSRKLFCWIALDRHFLFSIAAATDCLILVSGPIRLYADIEILSFRSSLSSMIHLTDMIIYDNNAKHGRLLVDNNEPDVALGQSLQIVRLWTKPVCRFRLHLYVATTYEEIVVLLYEAIVKKRVKTKLRDRILLMI